MKIKKKYRTTDINATDIIAFVLISAATIGIYFQVLHHEFINYDDPAFITDNPFVRMGLKIESLKWAFTSFLAGNYHPLTNISHILDVEFFGLDAGWHHFTNLILHLLNSLILYGIIRRINSSMFTSLVISALFALHPLHVESVAWVSERKDVLSTFFFMLTIWAYINYANKKEVKASFLWIFILYLMGLLSKPILVTLPFVLLLLDLWPLNRIHIDRFDMRFLRRFIDLSIEKIPLFILSLASCIITVIAQKETGSVAELSDMTIDIRIANAILSYAAYLFQMIFPVNLCCFYPFETEISPFKLVTAIVVLLFISILSFYHAKRRPYLLVGWLWYLGTLVPVIGFVQVGDQAMADRYTYIPLIGIFIMIVFLLSEIESPIIKKSIYFISGFIIVVLMPLTYIQIGFWSNSIKLFSHALDVTENNKVAHLNLGVALANTGEYEKAKFHYEETLKIYPASREAHNNMGILFFKAKEFEKAEQHFKEAIESDPKFQEAYINMAILFAEKKEYPTAFELFQKAIKTGKENANIYYNLGKTYVAQKEYDKGILNYEKALKFDPGYAPVHLDLGVALSESKKIEDAFVHFEKALLIKPNYKEAYFHRGLALEKQKKIFDAEDSFKKALNIDHDYVSARFHLAKNLTLQGKNDEAVLNFNQVIEKEPLNKEAFNSLGAVLMAQNKIDQAIIAFGKAIEIDSSYNEPYNNLGLAWAREGKKEDALAQYQKALELKEDHKETHNNMANLFAETGKIDDAVKHYRRAIEIDSNYAEPHYNLGNLLANLNMPNEAAKEYEEAIRINPEYLEVYNNFGVLLGKYGKIDEAIAMFDEALKRNPNYPDARKNRDFAVKLKNER